MPDPARTDADIHIHGHGAEAAAAEQGGSMKTFVSGHRAGLGVLGVGSLAGLFLSLAIPSTSTLIEVALLALALFGFGALLGSPYWRIIYRESPLRRAISGETELDERELALRDRANGLAYILFAAANMVALSFALPLVRLDRIVLSADTLMAAMIPYAAFAFALPVILVEWFEPSGERAPPMEEDEE